MGDLECILWPGAVDEDGYGIGRFDGVVRRVHRAIYEREVGPIPDGHDLHHSCETTNCIRKEHLLPEPHTTHARHHRIDKCGRGHRFTPDSFYVSNGRRNCLACKRDRRRSR